MNKFWKKKIFWITLFKVTITLFVVSGAVVLMGFVESRKQELICKKMNISIDYGTSPKFMFEEILMNEINKIEGKVTGKPANMIRVEKIEAWLKSNPYTKSVDVFTSTDGDLFINIIQRRAILRIINSQNQSLYIDDEGILLPFDSELPYRLTLATGNIQFSYENFADSSNKFAFISNQLMIKKLVRLAHAINNDAFLAALTDQIFVQDVNHFELYPKLGGHLILLGDVDHLNEKFSNLVAFYEEGIKKIGWENCIEISLKNNNQVVCKIKQNNGI